MGPLCGPGGIYYPSSGSPAEPGFLGWRVCTEEEGQEAAEAPSQFPQPGT